MRPMEQTPRSQPLNRDVGSEGRRRARDGRQSGINRRGEKKGNPGEKMHCISFPTPHGLISESDILSRLQNPTRDPLAPTHSILSNWRTNSVSPGIDRGISERTGRRETGMNGWTGLTSLLGVKTMMKKRTSCEFLPMFAACFKRAMATCLFCREGSAHLNHRMNRMTHMSRFCNRKAGRKDSY